jgi:lipopolysaccharide O-acetyltransferase
VTRSALLKWTDRRLFALLGVCEGSLARLRSAVALGAFGAAGQGCYIGGFDLLTSPEYVCLGDSVRIRSHVRLEAIREQAGYRYAGSIRLGSDCHLESYVHIGAAYGVELAEGVAVGSRVTIIDHDHLDGNGTCSVMSRPLQGAPICIGAFSWIGDGAVILKGVELGERCVVGANAVVTRSYPSGTLLVGNPAVPMRRGDAA